CIKYGRSREGRQRYKCKSCGRLFMTDYVYKACMENINSWIMRLVKEGSGIRSIGRLLGISCTTVLKRILQIAKSIRKPVVSFNKSYEVDEMCTFYQKKTKLLWVAYALEQDSRRVTEFAVGSRTKSTLQKVVSTLFLSAASKIYTDRLNIYSFLIPAYLHCANAYRINHIERKNLSIRTHLKRLGRRTICYSKSVAMLAACLKIYFWS